MSNIPVWFDTSVLIDIESGALAGGLDEVARMKKDGFNLLVPKHVETEFLYAKASPAEIVKRQAYLIHISVRMRSYWK